MLFSKVVIPVKQYIHQFPEIEIILHVNTNNTFKLLCYIMTLCNVVLCVSILHS